MSGGARHTGGCLCGGVRYAYAGPLRAVVACHCEQCRRTSGHFAAATHGRREHLTLTRDDGLRWFASSPGVQRGFCGTCGASLFWEREGTGGISIMAGTLDRPTGLRLVQHIFTAHAGDYYAVDPGLPQADGWAEMPPVPADDADSRGPGGP